MIEVVDHASGPNVLCAQKLLEGVPGPFPTVGERSVLLSMGHEAIHSDRQAAWRSAGLPRVF